MQSNFVYLYKYCHTHIYQEQSYATPFTTKVCCTIACMGQRSPQQVQSTPKWLIKERKITNSTSRRGCQCHSRCPRTCPAHYWSHWNGYIYAKLLSQAGWRKSVYFRCVDQHWRHPDPPEKYASPVRFHPCSLISRPSLPCCSSADTPGVYPQKNGYAILRSSDYIIYSVGAEFIERVVAQYGPCEYGSGRYFKHKLTWILATKVNAIIAGQTSVKAPKKAAVQKTSTFSLVIHYTG